VVTKRKHAMGSGGFCFCPKCGARVEHMSGVPCQESRCPECGAKLLREGSEHDRLFREKQARKQQE
jgi:DNA-directed RNA polymerase subunit RPC12/RpoP